jgi:hypothetical protein
MSTDIIREFLADALSTMTADEMKNVFMNTPDKDLETVGAAVLVEKRKKTTQTPRSEVKVPMGNAEESEVAKTAKKPKTASNKAVAKKPAKKASAQRAGLRKGKGVSQL